MNACAALRRSSSSSSATIAVQLERRHGSFLSAPSLPSSFFLFFNIYLPKLHGSRPRTLVNPAYTYRLHVHACRADEYLPVRLPTFVYVSLSASVSPCVDTQILHIPPMHIYMDVCMGEGAPGRGECGKKEVRMRVCEDVCRLMEKTSCLVPLLLLFCCLSCIFTNALSPFLRSFWVSSSSLLVRSPPLCLSLHRSLSLHARLPRCVSCLSIYV